MRLRTFFFSLTVCLAMSTSAWADHPELTSYELLVDHVSAWEAAGATVTVPAVSNEGRDIFLVSVGTGPFTLLSVNELHANEPSGTEQFVRLIWALLGDVDRSLEGDVWPGIAQRPPVIEALADDAVRQELLSRVTVVGFAMLDPDGVENGHTRDFLTNTDFSTRVTPASAALQAALVQFHPDLLIDSHGGPPEPMNIGLVEPFGVEPAVVASSRAAAATAWRATEAVGAPAKYFEEHPGALLLGQHDDPVASLDEAYYAALARGAPLTVESIQLEGLPATYTETVGLQSTDPEISVISGASLQENILAVLAFEGAGLLTSERPRKVVEQSASGTISAEVVLPVGATRLFATVHWPWVDAPQDWTLELVDGGGDVVASSEVGAPSPYRRSRAILASSLAPGTYHLRASQSVGTPIEVSTLRTIWYEPDPGVSALTGLVDGTAAVELCLPGGSAFRTLVTAVPHTSGLGSPTCSASGAPAPPSEPPPATEPSVAPTPAGPSMPATGGGLTVLGLTLLGASISQRVARRR